ARESDCAARRADQLRQPRSFGLGALDLLPLETGAALLQESRDSLPRIRGPEHGSEPLLLGSYAFVDVALVRDRLDLLDCQRGLAGQLARPIEGDVEQLVVRHYPVRQTDAIRLLSQHCVTGQVHL